MHCLPGVQSRELADADHDFFFVSSSLTIVSVRFVEDILAFLGAQCPWLHSMTWQLCARCDLCVGEDEDPEGCSWHHAHSCLHPDCAHFIPLDSQPLRCDKTYKLNSLLTEDKLQPWIKVHEHYEQSTLENQATKYEQ